MHFQGLSFAAILVAVGSGCIERIPPPSLTETTMTFTKRRILLYAQAHNALPPSLTSLSPMKGYNNEIHDGWGRALTYQTNSAGMITLKSLGRDGVPGGTGDDADIIHSFPTRNAQGEWSYEFVGWNDSP
jgi:hypothetical protein